MLDTKGNVTNWNTGAEAIKGYKADEIVGRHFSLFYTPEDRAGGAPERALLTAMRDGKFAGEAQRVRKGGELFWASVAIDPIFDDVGDHIGFAKVTRDITEKRLAEEEVARSREDLAQAQKMEAIGRLTGGVAHDFNNLLTVICASADFLQRPSLSEDKRQRYVSAIAETAERATILTGQLLAFARRQPLQPVAFDVQTRLRSIEAMIAATLGSSAALIMDLAGAEHIVEADPSQFETAILNIVINAKDAMVDGGTVSISSSSVESVPAVRGHVAAEGSFVAIQIADTGTGIPPETIASIFEPFFTTKPVDKGTGLGLSQVYGFAKQSRGEIDVASEIGKGTIFTLYLPTSDSKPASVPADRSPGVVNVPSRAVLLVEDNERVGNFATELLEELGQTVTWVGDGQAALNLLDQRASEFDLVFSDVVMPGMSGIELGRNIRAKWPALRVVLTSGYSHVLAEEGTHGFSLLKKPYAIDGLLRILRS